MANNAFELAVELIAAGVAPEDLVAAFEAAVAAQGFRYCPLALELILSESGAAAPPVGEVVPPPAVEGEPAPLLPDSFFSPGDVPRDPPPDGVFSPLPEEGSF